MKFLIAVFVVLWAGYTVIDSQYYGCVWECETVPTGYYQSCLGCDVYATCFMGLLYDNRSCPPEQKWDDILKRCDFNTTTCFY